MRRDAVLGLIVEVLPCDPFPCWSVWSPSYRNRTGSRAAGRLVLLERRLRLLSELVLR